MTTRWPARIEGILDGDQAVALAYVTPARGVVLTPLTNFGLGDSEGGTLTPINSSIGMWKKLRRLQANPQVALAYHTRQHGSSTASDFVLVQGTASLSPLGDRGWIERHRESWERSAGPRRMGPLWERWLRVYHWRVAVRIAVERLVIWPELDCSGEPEVFGSPLPSEEPEAHRPPRLGTAPRVDHVRAAKRAGRLPNVLLGWVGRDGFPLVVAAQVGGREPHGVLLDVPAEVVPSGGRRAGLLAHTFARFNYGQDQRRHTGWLEVVDRQDGGPVVYAPHTEAGYRLPPSRALYRLSAGFVTRRGFRAGRRAGFVPVQEGGDA